MNGDEHYSLQQPVPENLNRRICSVCLGSGKVQDPPYWGGDEGWVCYGPYECGHCLGKGYRELKNDNLR